VSVEGQQMIFMLCEKAYATSYRNLGPVSLLWKYDIHSHNSAY